MQTASAKGLQSRDPETRDPDPFCNDEMPGLHDLNPGIFEIAQFQIIAL
jgi:hypothetical protein